MKHLLIFIALFYFPLTSLAQFELDSLKQKWENIGREPIEGIYSISGSSRSYSIALAKDEDVYKLVYLKGGLENWVYGDLKGMIARSEEMYEGRWNAGKPTKPNLEDIKIVFGNKKFILYWSDWSIDEFKMIYPEKATEPTDMDKVFMDEAFKRDEISIPIQLSDSGSVQIPVLVNDVLKIYVGLKKTSKEVIVSKDIAKTLIETKTLGYKEWKEGNYYQFIDDKKAFAPPHIFSLNSLALGEGQLTNLETVISEDISRSMFISFDVLERFGKVNIDLDKLLLTIKPL
ncbi:hypothetical protein SAMN05661096_02599 [Marivirga sericea]|uniref:Uncharacterized protein n=1 Tax=Marivirga sericea TaxID=1028 RepID=A0A1X7KD80_9BACT|nr:hypothetical protein [Marivirga sericea]SMG39027.1 hypothetical protein SAMN05661096_02599 [Marivirga sericea]